MLESSAASGGYGILVCLQHRPHLATCYAHLAALASTVKPGGKIRRGQVVGLVGSTGSSTAPHLHFEVRRGAAACQACAIDPLALLDGEVPQAPVPEMVALPHLLPATTAPGPRCARRASDAADHADATSIGKRMGGAKDGWVQRCLLQSFSLVSGSIIQKVVSRGAVS